MSCSVFLPSNQRITLDVILPSPAYPLRHRMYAAYNASGMRPGNFSVGSSIGPENNANELVRGFWLRRKGNKFHIGFSEATKDANWDQRNCATFLSAVPLRKREQLFLKKIMRKSNGAVSKDCAKQNGFLCGWWTTEEFWVKNNTGSRESRRCELVLFPDSFRLEFCRITKSEKTVAGITWIVLLRCRKSPVQHPRAHFLWFSFYQPSGVKLVESSAFFMTLVSSHRALSSGRWYVTLDPGGLSTGNMSAASYLKNEMPSSQGKNKGILQTPKPDIS